MKDGESTRTLDEMIDEAEATPKPPPSGPSVKKSRKPMSPEARAAKNKKDRERRLAKSGAKKGSAAKTAKKSAKRAGKGSAASARPKKKSGKRGAKRGAKSSKKNKNGQPRKKYVRNGKLAKAGKFCVILWVTGPFQKKFDRACKGKSRASFLRELVERRLK